MCAKRTRAGVGRPGLGFDGCLLGDLASGSVVASSHTTSTLANVVQLWK